MNTVFSNGVKGEVNTKNNNILKYCSFVISLLILVYFYAFVVILGGQSILESWRSIQKNFEDTIPYLFPILTCVLLWMTRKQIMSAPRQMDCKGMLITLLGVICFVVSCRTIQVRLAIGSFPLVVMGMVWFYFGWQVTKWFVVPLGIHWVTLIPLLEGFSSKLQIISTSLANCFVGFFGVETYAQGTNIYSSNGNWDAFSIEGGCSGMNSLIALLLISGAWAYLSHMKTWQKLVLFLSAVPLALVGNAFRLTSIFLAADYVDPNFAATTWHDWSGLLLFFPISLIMLFFIQSLLIGELPSFLKRKKKRIVRSTNVEVN